MTFKQLNKPAAIVSLLLMLGGIAFLIPDAKAIILQQFKSSETNVKTDNQNNKPNAVAATSNLAPAIVFRDESGKTVDISKQKGKVLFINFWATWCPPCIEEMPSIHKLKAELAGKDILFLMVDVDNNFKKSSKFMAKHQYQLPVYTTTDEIPQEMLSGAIPTTVIIDKFGRVVGKHEGGADYAHPEVVKYFKELTAQ